MKNKLFLCVFLFFFISCSSAPKRSMQETEIYNSAFSALEQANAQILCGNYENANFLLSQAYKSSMAIDNYDLLVSVLLTRISLELSVNPPQIEKANEYLQQAKILANHSDSQQKMLALCILSEVRIATATNSISSNELSSLLTKLEENKKSVKGDSYNEANFDSAMGDIYKLQENYSQAEKAFLAAAKSFTDNRYLSEIGINWYKTAQVRSLSGNKKGALEALENAIIYDRLAENSSALAADYYAKGTVLLKGNPTKAETEEADFAFQHSKDILSAIQ